MVEAWPQRDLLIQLSGPLILLLRFCVCQSASLLAETAVCDVSALMRILSLHQPWEVTVLLTPGRMCAPSGQPGR